MKNYNYPIIIGCYDKPDKCVIAFNCNEVKGIVICRLKELLDGEVGQTDVPNESIGSVIQEIRFGKRESLRTLIKTLQYLDEHWDGFSKGGSR